MTIKAFLKVSLLSLSLGACTVFKTFEKMQAILLYWFAAQQQTSTLRRQKISLFDAKFSADFNELKSFLLKATGSRQKMAQTKVVRRNANWCRSEAKG